MSTEKPALQRYAPAVAALTWGIVAVTGSLANTRANIAWYDGQRKPAWRPPNWLFAPAWTTLYSLLAVSTARVLRAEPSAERDRALVSYGVNAVLNGLWSWLFFAWKLKGPAAFEIALVLMTAVLMAEDAARLDRAAALLVAPYIAWVTFATSLAVGVWVLNRGAVTAARS